MLLNSFPHNFDSHDTHKRYIPLGLGCHTDATSSHNDAYLWSVEVWLSSTITYCPFQLGVYVDASISITSSCWASSLHQPCWQYPPVRSRWQPKLPNPKYPGLEGQAAGHPNPTPKLTALSDEEIVPKEESTKIATAGWGWRLSFRFPR